MSAIILARAEHALVDGSEDEPGPIVVRNWRDDPELVPEFKAGEGHNRKRLALIDLVVWHWTGGEGDGAAVVRTLRKRSLGVEFLIQRDGEVWQMCDPALVDTADAGTLNFRSVGVEISCYGYASWDIRRRVFRVPPKARDRETYRATIHGKTFTAAKFYPAQMRSAKALAVTLSSGLIIPMRVPRQEEAGVLPELHVKGPGRFTGHVGRYHASENKRDPGPWFMDELRDAFTEETVRRMRARKPPWA